MHLTYKYNKNLIRCIFTFTVFLIAIPSLYCQANSNSNHYQKSLDYFNEGKDKLAMDEINLFLIHHPNNTEGLILRAYFHIQNKEPQKAIDDYTTILKYDGNNTSALSNRALLYMEEERYISALDDLNKRIAINPKDWSAFFDRAYCYGLKGDHEKAVIDFDTSIKLNPNHAATYANRGFSKINSLTTEGLIRPAPEQCIDACLDLRKALAMGDSTVTQMISLYCPKNE